MVNDSVFVYLVWLASKIPVHPTALKIHYSSSFFQ